MSRRDRNDRGALVALGLILGAVILFALLEFRARQTFDNNVRQSTATKEQNQDYSQSVEPEIGAPDYLVFGDTIAQWLMAGFAVLATGVSFVGVLWIRETLEETRRTAKAAIKANKLAEHSLRVSQRALLVHSDLSVVTYVNPQIGVTGFGIDIRFKNTGPTPALDVLASGSIVVFDHPIPEDFSYPDRGAAMGGRSTVGKDVQSIITLQIALEDVLDIREKVKFGYVYAWIEYKDIFEPEVWRRTEFCGRIEAFGDVGTYDPNVRASLINLFPVGRYNAINEQCVYEPGTHPPVGGDLPPVRQPRQA